MFYCNCIAFNKTKKLKADKIRIIRRELIDSTYL